MKKNYWTAMLVFESRIFQLSRICTMHDISDVIKSYFSHTLLLSSDRSGVDVLRTKFRCENPPEIELSITPSWHLYSSLIVEREGQTGLPASQAIANGKEGNVSRRKISIKIFLSLLLTYDITSPLLCNVIHLTWQNRNTRKIYYEQNYGFIVACFSLYS